MIEFFVVGEPVSWQRGGRNGGRTFTPKSTRDAEQRIIDAFHENHPGHVVIEGECTIDVNFYNRTKVRRDLDNQLKLVLDALNHVAYIDDRQIVRLSARRLAPVGDEVAGTWVRIGEKP